MPAMTPAQNRRPTTSVMTNIRNVRLRLASGSASYLSSCAGAEVLRESWSLRTGRSARDCAGLVTDLVPRSFVAVSADSSGMTFASRGIRLSSALRCNSVALAPFPRPTMLRIDIMLSRLDGLSLECADRMVSSPNRPPGRDKCARSRAHRRGVVCGCATAYGIEPTFSVRCRGGGVSSMSIHCVARVSSAEVWRIGRSPADPGLCTRSRDVGGVPP